MIDDKLDVSEIVKLNECRLKIESGTLIGIGRDEFGGLLFQPRDTSNKTVVIKRGNIKFVFNFKNNVYFIERLAKVGFNNGALFELDTTSGFTFAKLLDFEDSPEAFTIYKDKLLIATNENFYIVQNFKKDLVFKMTFWRGLYPNSIVAFDNKNVFIGMKSGIVKLNLADTTMKFYKHQE